MRVRLEIQAAIGSRRIHYDHEPSRFEVIENLLEPFAPVSAIRLLMDLVEGKTE